MFSLLTNLSVAQFVPVLPQRSKGACSAGSRFRVDCSNAAGLPRTCNITANDIPCVFAAGVPPTEVPRGAAHGLNTDIFGGQLFNPFAAAFWKGKMFTQIQCDSGQNEHIMFNFVMKGQMQFPAYASIGPLPAEVRENYGDGEAFLPYGDYLLIDYGRNYEDICPITSTFMDKPFYSAINWQMWNNSFGIGNILDVVRVIGTTEGGWTTLLGNTLVKDAVTGTYYSLGYFLLETSPKTYVHEGHPVDEITVPASFHYHDQGFIRDLQSFLGLYGPQTILENMTEEEMRDRIGDLVAAYDKQNLQDSIRAMLGPLTLENYAEAIPRWIDESISMDIGPMEKKASIVQDFVRSGIVGEFTPQYKKMSLNKIFPLL